MLVVDSGGVSLLAGGSPHARAALAEFARTGLWPLVVPSAVLIECLTGHPGRDASTNQFLKSCRIETDLSTRTARRAAHLRFLAGRGSAVDALLVAMAEPGGSVFTRDPKDIAALASHSRGVTFNRS